MLLEGSGQRVDAAMHACAAADVEQVHDVAGHAVHPLFSPLWNGVVRIVGGTVSSVTVVGGAIDLLCPGRGADRHGRRNPHA